MSTRIRRIMMTASMVGVAACVLSASACGGSDDADGGESRGETGSEQGSLGAGDGDDYCELIENAENTFGTIEQNDLSDTEKMDTIVATIQEIGDAAPPEISSDWAILADAMTALKGIDDPTMFDPEVLTDIETASASTTAHVLRVCGLDLSRPTP